MSIDGPVGATAMLRRGDPPLGALLALALDRVERRHLELMHHFGFTDVRKAHNAVFAHLPDGGLRLTELAGSAGISKQAMAELVDDLAQKGYLAKVADPADGRAKLIIWAERGLEAHERTLEVFATIDGEVESALGSESSDALRHQLGSLITSLDGEPHT